MRKQVIFVQGTAYSGSTFFHMTLANDPRGFACGEVHAMYRPSKSSHVRRACTCGFDECQTWPKIIEASEDKLYQHIFELHPDLDFVVDSSKQPFWIKKQNENLIEQGISFQNLLIWKSPLEFAQSKIAKGQNDWARVWISNHRLYLSLISGLRTIKYKNLVTDKSTLRTTCDFLGLPFFHGKEEYWQKKHCVLGGSKTARYHLYNDDFADQVYDRLSITSRRIEHRTVSYAPVEDIELCRLVEEKTSATAIFGEIEKLLQYCDISNDDYNPDEFQHLVAPLKMPNYQIKLLRAKYAIRCTIGKSRYGAQPRFAESKKDP